MSVTIRKIDAADVPALYALGLATPELQVAETDPFMEPDEFRDAVLATGSVSILAEAEGSPVGFIYASRNDAEKPGQAVWACLVYLAVDAQHRHRGIASALYDACAEELRKAGVKKLYGWAREEEGEKAIQDFLARKGFKPGHRYRWFDTDLHRSTS